VYSPHASRHSPQRFDPVGTCIYCGATHPVPLTKEHILPQGLGGGLILPESSCETCRRITQDIETTCLRHMSLLTYRLKAGLVQHLHEIPSHVKERPHFLLLPIAKDPPGILDGRQVGLPMRYDLRLAANTHPAITPTIDLVQYFRMIAKIAHGFAVARAGIDAFEHHLPHIIIRSLAPVIPYLIGRSNSEIPVRPDALSHQLGLGLEPNGQGGYLVSVRVCLFAFNKGPAYDVIAGPLLISRETFEARLLSIQAPSQKSSPRPRSDKPRDQHRRGRASKTEP
jgi:hypothetical protein